MTRRVGVAFTLAGCLIAAVPSAARAETANRIAAIVNDELITEADVTVHVNAFSDEQSAMSETPSAVDMKQAVLAQLIDQRLILQEARRMELVVSTEDVLDRLAEMRERFASELQFRQFLQATALTVETLKERLRDQLLVQRAIDAAVRSKISVSPQEIAAAVEQSPELSGSGERLELFHILLRVDESRTAEEARAQITDLHEALTGGADFAEQAKQHSDGPYAPTGGAMGWVTAGSLMPELDAAVQQMAEGDVSRPIQTRLGFHLVKVGRRQSAPEMDRTDAHRIAGQTVYQKKYEQRLREWLAELRDRAYIELRE